jgi:glycosyltransferase involved in cell wall biosynthesis
MPAPRCSVIIPTYNCRAFLSFALASVRMQELDDIEIIVVDDGSDDGTQEWLNYETLGDSRLVPLQLDRKGPSHARNHALAHARGSYVALLDADDLWWPQKLNRQLAYHERHPDVAFSFTDYLHVDMAGGIHGTCFEYWQARFGNSHAGGYTIVPDAELEILGANVVGTSTVVAPLKALQDANGFAAKLHSAEDWWLWLKLARSGRVACAPAVTMSYLMRPCSVTQNRAARIESMRAIVEPYEARREPRARRAWQRAMSRIDIASAEHSRLSGAYWAAARAHMRAFFRCPNLRVARAAAADVSSALSLRNA